MQFSSRSHISEWGHYRTDSPNPQKKLLRERKGGKVEGKRVEGSGGRGISFHKTKLVVL